jgi:hypothetical protein
MRTATPTLNDQWIRLAGLPLVAVLGNFVFYEPDNTLHHVSRGLALLLSLLETVLQWEVSRRGILLARRQYPLLNQTRPRILYQVIWFVATTILIRVALTYAYDVTRFWGYPMTLRSYGVNVLVPFFFTVPLAAIYEGQYLYQRWWTTYYEAERLKKENLQSQLDSLKAQISPHFLFNTLSTLSSLVSEDPRKAERFIEELASVYRYVLQTNEQPLTTLANEIRFIEAYFHLLQTRFGAGIALEVDVEERHHAFLLPPLTLQLLVENAVKHNAVLPARPLRIRIFSDEADNLYVRNNLQKKQHVIPSHHTGLRNITGKYRLLNQPDVVVKQTDACFQVMLPLIKVPAHASVAH